MAGASRVRRRTGERTAVVGLEEAQAKARHRRAKLAANAKSLHLISVLYGGPLHERDVQFDVGAREGIKTQLRGPASIGSLKGPGE